MCEYITSANHCLPACGKSSGTEQGQEYDVIFDTLGKSLFKANIKRLSKNGRYLLADPKFREIIKGFWLTKTSTKKIITAFANHDAEQLIFLKKLVEE